MRVIAALRAAGVSWPRIHAAETWLRQHTGCQRPFATEQLWTDQSDVLAPGCVQPGTRARSRLVAPPSRVPGPDPERTALRPPSAQPQGVPRSRHQHGQLAMSILKDYLIPVSGLQFQDHVASKWSPQPGVMLDPSVQFGEPCIQDTRIPTSALWSLVHGGDPPDLVARSYRITPQELTAPCTGKTKPPPDHPHLWPRLRAAWDLRSIAPSRTPVPTSPAQVPSGRRFKLARLPRNLLGAHPTVACVSRPAVFGGPCRTTPQGTNPLRPSRLRHPGVFSRDPAPRSSPAQPKRRCRPDHPCTRAQSRHLLLRSPSTARTFSPRLTLKQIPRPLIHEHNVQPRRPDRRPVLPRHQTHFPFNGGTRLNSETSCGIRYIGVTPLKELSLPNSSSTIVNQEIARRLRVDINNLNEVFTAWTDLGRTSSPNISTSDRWNEMIGRLSSEGQRRLRFIETSAYAATYDSIPDNERSEVARYIVLLGLLSDIGYNRPLWLQRHVTEELQGALLGLEQREVVYRGIASSFEDRWVPEDAVRPHRRLVEALRGLADVDRATAEHLRLHRNTKQYLTGENEMRTAFQNIDRSTTDIQSILQVLFRKN